ncbi:hypothetical protein J9253_16210 [Thiothrix litoralis]|jgi:hypothetical protein|uniref:Uncharacterized protein n=1 Tax=Thiothrix litoralis TaxID=2891210 RepID=A0ABX7WQ35_9GAMM|nr:hypothetical protein [Thiothrix litoralis]QTR45532.1 hypothetical protein J9253_16210 [Thiothrix litoralis]
MSLARDLIDAARRGTLDCSALQAHQQAAQHRTDTARNARLRALLGDIRGLDALFAHAGIPMDVMTAAKRAAWIAEYNTLRQEGQP